MCVLYSHVSAGMKYRPGIVIPGEYVKKLPCELKLTTHTWMKWLFLKQLLL